MTRWNHRITLFVATVGLSFAVLNKLGAQEISLPYIQTFNTATTGSPGTLPANWQQVTEGTTDNCSHGNTVCYQWGVRSGTTPSSNTGPSSGRGGSGNYVYMEASGNDNDTVSLRTPSFNLNGEGQYATISFWSHSRNGNNNLEHDLIIDVVDAATGAYVGTGLLTIGDTDVNDWVNYQVDLSAYADSGNIRVQFKWVNGSASWELDHAVDDVTIFYDYCDAGFSYKDEFASATYNNSNGTINWTSESWTETDDDGSPTTGEIVISGGELRMNNSVGYATGDQPAVTRSVDLSGSANAILTFDYSETANLEGSDEFEVSVYDGTSWTVLLSVSNDFGSESAIFDISDYANANTQIRVQITSFYGATDEILMIDNIEICYSEAGAARDIYLEAECGYVGSGWFTDTDATASNTSYVEPKVGQESLTSAPTDTSDYLTYAFYVDTTASYKVYGRIIATQDTADSYWVRANYGTWYKWDSLSVNSSWTWLQVEDSDADTFLTFPLDSGINRLDFAYREDGAQLDKLFVTLTGTTPTGSGENASNCDFLFGQDTDGDGIADETDIDDDNDGILDVIESPATIDFGGTRTLLVGSNQNDLQVGDKILYANAIRNCNDILFDVVISITSISNLSSEVQATDRGVWINLGNPSNDDHFTFTFKVVESGSATVGNPEGTKATITDFILKMRDIDSTSPTTDFTELTGYNDSTPPDSVWLDPNTLLEQAGYDNGGGPSGYTQYRLIPNSTIPFNDWTTNDNSTDEDVENTVFLLFNTFDSIAMSYGVTGGDSGTGGARLTGLSGEKECDRDGDGIPNRLDLDLDNDGIFDMYEAGHSESDLDDDGRMDGANLYSGANGLFDSIETTPESGVINYTYSDSDGDGIQDFFSRDSDGDGCFDTQEEEINDPDVDGIAGSGTATADANGLVISIVYDIPPTTSWQDSILNCLEICDNGIDDDGDGLIDDDDPDCANYYLEAECGFPGANWDRLADTTASNDDYLTISMGLNSLTVPPTAAADLVRFTVNVSTSGTYRLLGRVKSATGADDSFWFRVDEGTWYKWNDWNTNGAWEWVVFSDNDDGNTAVKYSLTPGNHTVDIAYREDGAQLDKLHMTINGSTPSGEGEESINCGRTMTPNLFLPFKILNKT